MIAAIACGCFVGFLATKTLCLGMVMQSDKEMSKICRRLAQLRREHQNSEVLNTYFSEIMTGVADYYNSKSSKKMNNWIIVKWSEALLKNDHALPLGDVREAGAP